MRFIKVIKNIVAKNRLAVFVIIIAAFLRLYRLSDFSMFLADQGRDALIVLRIIRLEHFPAIGAPSSVGDVYLGPFYYYLIAPFLLIFRFNPVGLAFGVSLLSIIGLIFSYFIIKQEIDYKTAIIFLILASFSFVNVELSRFSWNPNLLSVFSFFTLYFFYKLITDRKILYAGLFGAFLSFSIQLHYLAIFLFAPPTIIIFQQLTNKKLKKIKFIKELLIAAVTFVLFTSPLILFDLRHDFLNTKNLIKLFTEKNVVAGGAFINRFLETNQALINHIFQLKFNNSIAFLITLLIALACFVFFKKKRVGLFVILNFINIITFILLFSVLNSQRHPHYYGSIYYSFFLVTAFLLTSFKKKRVFYLLTIVFISIYIIFNAGQYYFIFNKSDNSQIAHSKKLADFLAPKIANQPFNFATYPVEFTSEDNYLYFLELAGQKAADRKKFEVTDQMFVLCNKEPCRVINSTSWNISMFGRAKIDKIWGFEDLKIFKLVHEK